MAVEPSRLRPHIYLPGQGQSQRYTAHAAGGGEGGELPPRNRAAHAEQLTAALTEAVRAGEALFAVRDPVLQGGTTGFYLEFELPADQADTVDKLESRQGKTPIELVAVRPLAPDQPDKVAATVFVPEQKRDYYLNKVAAYRDEDRKPSSKGVIGPKNERLVASIDTARLAVARSLYTDAPDLFPEPGKEVWWEVWLRAGTRAAFGVAAQRLNLLMREYALNFPDREVVLVCGTTEALGRIVTNTDSIAELRLARDTPGSFMAMEGAEQHLWSDDMERRVVAPPDDAPAVCVLDSGTTHRHPLIGLALTPADQQAYNANWSVEDLSHGIHGGHGTEMSGLSLYGDLLAVLTSSAPVELMHRLESVKILPDHGFNDPDLYGAITAQSIARAEIVSPLRPRAICLAVTSAGDHWRGRPSSWSAELDRLAYDTDQRRLIVVSAGNIMTVLEPSDYLVRNDLSPIESPAQAWNVLTVGAYTENVTMADPTYKGWEPFAPAGDLIPRSRTSVTWHHDWPLKPDVVLEGGNLGIDPATGKGDDVDDLALLTTHRRPEERPFTTSGDTSAATALAARMSAQILVERPESWPETVRALIVHSAEWTPRMKAHLGTLDTKDLLRRYGFGVPSLHRALQSLDNDVTMIIERTLHPFQVSGSKISTKDVILHELPWPKDELADLGESQVEMRVTLSYFVEPNPGERGYTRRHGYASHGLRFAVKRGDERLDAFCRRINAEVGTRSGRQPTDVGWTVGPRLRHRGSLHADIWTGTAVELAERHAIAVYPVGGWWRENPSHQRGDTEARYSLVVSLRVSAGVDLYTAIQTQIAVEIPIET
jgi:Subtilase family